MFVMNGGINDRVSYVSNTSVTVFPSGIFVDRRIQLWLGWKQTEDNSKCLMNLPIN